jgi:NAD(P)H-dependent flavin oxidoreductase YrpB (nitropropane dioxygenase family)
MSTPELAAAASEAGAPGGLAFRTTAPDRIAAEVGAALSRLS